MMLIYLKMPFFFFNIKHIDLKLEFLQWAPGVQDVGVIQKEQSFVSVWIMQAHPNQHASPSHPIPGNCN